MTRFRWWPRRSWSREDDHFGIDWVAGRMFEDYQQAVMGGAPRAVLAEILTGLAGCELATSRTQAIGWGREPDPTTGRTAGEDCLHSGLLLLEIAYAARMGDSWIAPYGLEYLDHAAVGPLSRLARAYIARDCKAIGQALDDLCDAKPTEALCILMRAHGHEFQGRWKQRVEDGAA